MKQHSVVVVIRAHDGHVVLQSGAHDRRGAPDIGFLDKLLGGGLFLYLGSLWRFECTFLRSCHILLLSRETGLVLHV